MRIAIGITGASGALYASLLLKRLGQLREQLTEVAVVMTVNARAVWKHELGNEDYEQIPFRRYAPDDYGAPIASGSAGYDGLIVCPCSMGTLGRIASGTADDLIARASDVMLKERRRLILVIRDLPYHLIHLRNMVTVTEAGGIICPASPSFYSGAATPEQVALTVVDRVLLLAGFQFKHYRWGAEGAS
ncbi:MAG: UbiX family flavin prenyltransferase [Chitinophagales bacterium]|nr:UbiX family flavin prenyltransferase [Chitinophagales bacterium]MDW8392797.1 UbiX family flavin prenyltransferase [Chitinophagales bacterium]